MSTSQVRVAGTGLLFVLIVLSGLWVSGSGKPYSTFPFTIHKLAGLAAGILLAVIVYQTHRVDALSLLEIAAIVVTVLLFVGTVVAGALLSIDQDAPTVVLRLHQVVPVVTILAAAGTLYILLNGR
jgi:peptidoglycan/LPS O-acetylase OafA/YrhL